MLIDVIKVYFIYSRRSAAIAQMYRINLFCSAAFNKFFQNTCGTARSNIKIEYKVVGRKLGDIFLFLQDIPDVSA